MTTQTQNQVQRNMPSQRTNLPILKATPFKWNKIDSNNFSLDITVDNAGSIPSKQNGHSHQGATHPENGDQLEMYMVNVLDGKYWVINEPAKEGWEWFFVGLNDEPPTKTSTCKSLKDGKQAVRKHWCDRLKNEFQPSQINKIV